MRRIAGIFMIAASLFSCTEKGKPIHQHAADQRPTAPDSATRPDLTEVVTPEVRALQQQASQTTQPEREILRPLSEIVLSPARVRAQESLTVRTVREELTVFNQALQREWQQGGERAKATLPYLERYVRAVSLDCEKIADSCPGLAYFGLVPSSAQIVKLAAKNAPAAAEFYRRLYFVLHLKNEAFDRELLEMFVLRFEEGKKQAQTPEAKALLSSVVETVILSLKKADLPAAEERKFLEQLKAWTFIFGEGDKLSESSRNALFAMMAKTHLIYDPQGAINPQVAQMITDSQKVAGSFSDRQRRLREQKIFYPQAVGVKYVDGRDEYFFLVDRVFYGELTADQGAQIFFGTRRERERLKAMIMDYARIQFIFALFRSTQLAKDELFESNVATDGLLWHALRKSAVVKQVWGELRSRFEPLQKFAVLALRTPVGDDEMTKEVRSAFNNLEKTVKYSAVYPHMMILFHILSQKKFEMRFPFSNRAIDSALLMTLLYRGEIPPLFQYSDDEVPLNVIELFYAFDFAVRTNLFGVMGIDPDYFIADAVRRMSENQVKFIRDNMHQRTLRFNQSPIYQTWKRMCSEFNGNRPEGWSYYLREIRQSPYYGATIETAFTNISDLSSRSASSPGGLTEMTQGLNYIDGEFAESVEKVRVDMAQFVRMAEAMKTSYVSYLKRAHQLNDADIAKKTTKTDALLQEIRQLRKSYVEEALTRHQEIGRCFAKSMLRDYEVQQKMVETEQAYLRQVYRDMTKLRQGNLKPEEVAAIKERYVLKDLPDNFAGHDQIDGDGYRYNQIDLWIRMARYLSEGLTTDAGRLAPVAAHVRVEMGDSLDLDVSVIKESRGHSLPYTKTEDEFVAEAMKLLFAGKDPYLVWFSYPTGRVIRWEARQVSLTSLFRLEPGIIDQRFAIKAEELIDEQFDLMKIMRISPVERMLFGQVRMKEKFEPLYFMNRFVSYSLIRHRIRDTWGLFDLPARLMTEPLLGYTYDLMKHLRDPELIDPAAAGMARAVMPKRDGFINLGEEYYTSRSNAIRGKLLIPFNADLDRGLDRNITAWIQWEQQSLGVFKAALQRRFDEYRKLPAEDQPRIDISVRESISDPWLTPNILADFEVSLKRFHRRTESCYLQNSSCPAFAPTPAQ